MPELWDSAQESSLWMPVNPESLQKPDPLELEREWRKLEFLRGCIEREAADGWTAKVAIWIAVPFLLSLGTLITLWNRHTLTSPQAKLIFVVLFAGVTFAMIRIRVDRAELRMLEMVVTAKETHEESVLQAAPRA